MRNVRLGKKTNLLSAWTILSWNTDMYSSLRVAHPLTLSLEMILTWNKRDVNNRNRLWMEMSDWKATNLYLRRVSSDQWNTVKSVSSVWLARSGNLPCDCKWLSEVKTGCRWLNENRMLKSTEKRMLTTWSSICDIGSVTGEQASVERRHNFGYHHGR